MLMMWIERERIVRMNISKEFNFLIFYVGNSTSMTCFSIFFSVIVGCVMMRWKMNENFSTIKVSVQHIHLI